MKFEHVTIYVKDLKKSLTFYQGVLGLSVVRGTPEGHGPIFLGEEGKPLVELIGETENPAFAGFSVGFQVDSLEEATKKLEDAGYPRIRGPVSPSPRSIFSFFHDPDGVEIQLLERKP